jgi:GTPase
MAARRGDVVLGSALTGEGMAAFEAALLALLDSGRLGESVHLPHAAGRARAWLYAEGVVQSETPTETGSRLDLLWSARQRRRFALVEGAGDDAQDNTPQAE